MTSGFTALTRTVAMAVATALGLLTLLVAPASAADDSVETTLEVAQVGTWRPGGPLVLDVQVIDEAGRPVVDTVNVLVDGAPAALFIPASRELVIPKAPTEPGTHEVTVRYLGDSVHQGAEWTSVLEVEEGTVPATVTLDGPAEVPYQGVVDLHVEVARDDDAAAPGALDGRAVVTWDDPRMHARSGPVQNGSGVLQLVGAFPGTHAYEVTFYSAGEVATTRVSGTLTVAEADLPLEVSTRYPDLALSTGDAPWDVMVRLPRWNDQVDGTVSLYDGERLLRRTTISTTGPDLVQFELRPGDLPAGRTRLTARLTGSPYLADTTGSTNVEVNRLPADVSTERATARTFQWGRTHKIRVQVNSADRYWQDPDPTGRVTVYRGSRKIGTGTLDGSGDVVVKVKGKKIPVGRTKLRVVYAGDSVYRPRTTYRTVKVHKATTKVRAKILDKTVHRPQRVKVRLRLTSPSDVALTGKVRLKVDGRTVKTVRLKKKHDGSRTVSLPRSVGPTHHYLKVVYRATPTKKKSAKVPLYFRVF